MSENTNNEAVATEAEVATDEQVETVIVEGMSAVEPESAPEAEAKPAKVKVEDNSIKLLPTRQRIDLAVRENYADSVVYVTQNSEGRLRAAIAVEDGPVFKVGQTFEAKNPKTGHKYGELIVVGKVTAKGTKSGEVPEGKLPLRLVG